MNRRIVLTIAAAALAGGVWLANHWADRDRMSYPPPGAPDAPPPSSTLTDSVEIFQKAFWKRPAAADKIRHAERREWADADGVQKWQWFLAVEPSPELLKHLRDDNAFGLGEATPEGPPAGAPEWFAWDPARVHVLAARQGGMRLTFSTDHSVLYATDTGHGFRPGAPERPAAPAPASVPTGRLPLTPPPAPSTP